MKQLFILMYFLCAGSFFAQINLDSGLVACYPLNANAYEPVNHLKATFSHVTTTVNRFSAPYSAMAFSGEANSYIVLDEHALLKPGQLSFSAWIKPDQIFPQQRYLLYTANTIGTAAYALCIENTANGNILRVRKSNQVVSAVLSGTTVLAADIWYHVCFTTDNQTIKLYLNGVLENEINASMGFNYASGKKIYLGARDIANTPASFKGSLDDVRFYNRLLSASEVEQLYSANPSCIETSLAPVASFSMTSNLCISQKIEFTDFSVNDPDAWFWSVPGASPANSFEKNPVFSFSTPGAYSAILISSNKNGSNTAQVSFSVNPLLVVEAAASRTSVCQFDTFTLTAQGGASSYFWSSGHTGSSATLTTHLSKTYTVTGTDSLGCKATATVHVRVSLCEIMPTALSENYQEEFSALVYPNPSSGVFLVEVLPAAIKNYDVFDVLGVCIAKGKIDMFHKNTIHLGTHPNGVYFIKFTTEAGKTTTVKVVKKDD